MNNKYTSQLANDAKAVNNEAANKVNTAFAKADDKIDTYARQAGNVIDQLEDKAYDFAKSVGSFVQDQLSTNGKRVIDAKTKSEDTIKSYPLAATGLAFLGGWILSSLINSGRR